MPRASRAVMTTCTSAGASDSTSRCARLAAGAAHELMAEDGRPRVSVDGLDQTGQRAGRLRVAPLQVRALLQLEGSPQVLAVTAARQQEAVRGERGLRPPEHGLEVGRTGLRQTDVEEDLRGHGRVRRSGGTSRAARPASPRHERPPAAADSVTMWVSFGQAHVERAALLHLRLEPAHPAPQVEVLSHLGRARAGRPHRRPSSQPSELLHSTMSRHTWEAPGSSETGIVSRCTILAPAARARPRSSQACAAARAACRRTRRCRPSRGTRRTACRRPPRPASSGTAARAGLGPASW